MSNATAVLIVDTLRLISDIHLCTPLKYSNEDVDTAEWLTITTNTSRHLFLVSCSEALIASMHQLTTLCKIPMTTQGDINFKRCIYKLSHIIGDLREVLLEGGQFDILEVCDSLAVGIYERNSTCIRDRVQMVLQLWLSVRTTIPQYFTHELTRGYALRKWLPCSAALLLTICRVDYTRVVRSVLNNISKKQWDAMQLLFYLTTDHVLERCYLKSLTCIMPRGHEFSTTSNLISWAFDSLQKLLSKRDMLLVCAYISESLNPRYRSTVNQNYHQDLRVLEKVDACLNELPREKVNWMESRNRWTENATLRYMLLQMCMTHATQHHCTQWCPPAHFQSKMRRLRILHKLIPTNSSEYIRLWDMYWVDMVVNFVDGKVCPGEIRLMIDCEKLFKGIRMAEIQMSHLSIFMRAAANVPCDTQPTATVDLILEYMLNCTTLTDIERRDSFNALRPIVKVTDNRNSYLFKCFMDLRSALGTTLSTLV